MKLALVTALLTAVIISAQQIDWGSGNPTVAYVSPGKCIDNSGKYFGHFAPFPGQGRPWGAASDCLGYCMTSKDSNQNSEWAWQLNGVELVNVTHNNGRVDGYCLCDWAVAGQEPSTVYPDDTLGGGFPATKYSSSGNGTGLVFGADNSPPLSACPSYVTIIGTQITGCTFECYKRLGAVTSAPTKAPTTMSPVTSAPTKAPVTSAPTKAPTAPTTMSPVSSAPTKAPTTMSPVSSKSAKSKTTKPNSKSAKNAKRV